MVGKPELQSFAIAQVTSVYIHISSNIFSRPFVMVYMVVFGAIREDDFGCIVSKISSPEVT
jgi:hypothetical protein